MNNQQIALITGASRGIGLATAQCFQEQGWQVVNLSRQPCQLPEVINLSVDLADPHWQQQSGAIRGALKSATRICLVHNAGILFKDSVDELPEAQLRKTLEVNVVAPALLNQIVLPLMKKDSSIIYVGSTLSTKAAPKTASYVMSKHALLGLMRSTQQDLFGKGITSVCICPGFTDTDMVRELLQGHEANYQMASAMASANRMAEPREIAETIYFCATHPVVDGAVLHANLGQK